MAGLKTCHPQFSVYCVGVAGARVRKRGHDGTLFWVLALFQHADEKSVGAGGARRH